VDAGLNKHGLSNLEIKKYRSEIFQIPALDGDVESDGNLKSIIDDTFCRNNKVLPLKDNTIALVDPEFNNCIANIQSKMIEKKTDFKLVLIDLDQFEKGIQDYFQSNKGEDDSSLVLSEIGDTSKNIGQKQVTDIRNNRIDLANAVKIEEIPIDKLVNTILYDAIEGRASDIHIEHLGESVRVRYRVDGELIPKLIADKKIYSSLIARLKILSEMRLDEKRKPQDGRFSVKLDQHKIDFRVSSMPAYYGEKVVMRILDSYRGVKKLEEIGFTVKHLELIRKSLQRPYGMIIISGPTGSGKTTTLYSMINEIDRERKNVVSLEDPVEYNVPSMSQSQVFPEIGYTFASGLRSILRQDPDVIMVGEIRDKETAELAIQAALTGHLVFSTIHTNNSIGVITRMRDMGIDPFLIAPTIILSIAQRLLPQIIPTCVAPVDMTEPIKMMVDKQFEDLPEDIRSNIDLSKPFSEPLPNETSATGMKGRVPIIEVLNVDTEIQEIILKNGTEMDIYRSARKHGFLTLKEDAMIKSMNGKVPYVEINGL
jgi:type IV pilus assembly protein PilB